MKLGVCSSIFCEANCLLGEWNPAVPLRPEFYLWTLTDGKFTLDVFTGEVVLLPAEGEISLLVYLGGDGSRFYLLFDRRF